MKYLFFLIFLFSINSFAISCIDDDIDLNPGDVISADMIKDIFERISGITQGMKANQLDGTWVCTANTAVRSATSNNPLANNFIANENGIGESMTQEIVFDKQEDDTFLVSYEDSFQGSVPQQPSGPFSCKGSLSGGGMFSMAPSDNCSSPGTYFMRKTSKSCFVWGVNKAHTQSGVTECRKKFTVPLAPRDLTATLSGSSVSLSWDSGDSSTVSYTVKAKTSNAESFTDLIIEINGTTFTDTHSSGTKWYRVYGVNANGSSTGSNVVSITYSE